MSIHTQDSYEERLEKALFIASHPESLLTIETQSWLADKNNQQVYQQVLALRETAIAKEKAGNFDTVEAWKQFCQAHSEVDKANASLSFQPKARIFHNWRKWTAAAAISIPVILLASIAPIYHFTHQQETEQAELAQEQGTSHTTSTPSIAYEAVDSLASEKIEDSEIDKNNAYFHFENAPLEDIMAEVGTYYQMSVIFENEKACHLRFTFWASKKESINKTIDMLNDMGKAKFTIKDNQVIIQ